MCTLKMYIVYLKNRHVLKNTQIKTYKETKKMKKPNKNNKTKKTKIKLKLKRINGKIMETVKLRKKERMTKKSDEK